MNDFEKLLPSDGGMRPSRLRSNLRNVVSIAILHIRKLSLVIIFFIIASTFLAAKPSTSKILPGTASAPDAAGSYQAINSTGQNLHILIPATKADPNLCKLLFSASILDYPIPIVMAWDQNIDEDKQKGMVGGGTHLLKISKVLEWLRNLTPEHDDDLVVMMDGYDIWFQLRKELLIERYHQINADANKRIQKRMGRAARNENVKQTIIFGSGKRCYPNEIHTIACWPLPPSPLPKDMWEGNTDTTIGSRPNEWTATRQRFLNSGIIMGPAKDMRALFAQADKKVKKLGDAPEPDDNGSKWSEKVYHNSDQSVFNMIYGEQEFQREVIRRRYINWIFNPILKMQELFGKDLSDTAETLEGNAIKNILNPPWDHYHMDHLPGHPLEFHIGLDYWSSISFQTANSERNGGWMKYNEPLEAQVEHKGRWDCKPHLRALPNDITSSPPPFYGQEASTSDEKPANPGVIPANAAWKDMALYTNICAGVVPAMVHNNGDKGARERDWHKMWYQPYAKKLYDSQSPREAESLLKDQPGKQKVKPGGAFADTGKVLDFADICKDWDFS